MSVSAAVSGGFLGLAVLSTLVAVVGMWLSSDVFAKLIYGSILSGFSAVAVGLAVIVEQGLGTSTLQVAGIVASMAVCGAIASHRIAASAETRMLREDRRRHYNVWKEEARHEKDDRR